VELLDSRRGRRAQALDVGEFRQLLSDELTTDIHCVTKWSKQDTTWEGVSVDTLLEGVEAAASYVTAFSDGDYTTNLPLEDVTGGKAWVAYAYEGGSPWSRYTVARRACWYRTSTSGRAPSG
jgi:DMSO/TMAO reductase YedYZ molybdopterin-dependent catalytic subunit